MARTFIPTLLAIVERLCTYTTRYEETIREFMPDTVEVYFDTMIAACRAFLTAYYEFLSE